MNQITLGTVAPGKLNLNGDQGNLLALKRFLEAGGLSARVVAVTNTDEALACDFLLFGHGSMAAMESLDRNLASLDWNAILESVPGLAVGSGAEWLALNGPGAVGIQRVERVSEFKVAALGPLNVLGYRNSDTTLADLSMSGNFIISMLHGPVLAKNPALLARAARAAAAKAGVQINVDSAQFTAWVERLNRICGDIWKLEAAGQTYPVLTLH
jgi:lipid II isoglutaminyl synthase (glutamine-hydrolysing)